MLMGRREESKWYSAFVVDEQMLTASQRVYNRFGRTYLFDIDFYFLNEDHGHTQISYCIDAYHAGNVGAKVFEFFKKRLC